MSKGSAIQDNSIASSLGIAPAANSTIDIPLGKPIPASVVADIEASANNDTEIETDAKFARGNLYELLTKGAGALDELLEVAKQSQHPRAYEVAANLIKTLGDVNDKLLANQKNKKELKKVDVPKLNGDVSAASNTTIQQAVFVGSTTELLDLFHKGQEPQRIEAKVVK